MIVARPRWRGREAIRNGGDVLSLHYDSLRNISCAHDTANGRRVLVGRALATEFLELSTEENVRTYLVDAEGKKTRRRHEVHIKIEDTINNHPDDFCVLNGGIVIVARDYEADDKAKKLTLLNPSIINGAQTQGVLRDCAAEADLPEAYVTFEVIVTENEALIADVSIARNFQNDVGNISIAGRRGILDELEEALREVLGDVRLRKSETDRSDDFIVTEKLLQVIMALAPADVLMGTKVGDRESKAYTYSQKATCLKDFSNVHDAAKKEGAGANAALYEFFLQIAPTAYGLYEKWKAHPGFKGTGIRKIERDGREIVEVPDGIIFPIICSLSVFATKTRGGWTIAQPDQLTDAELIAAAKTAYMQIADHNPQTMGKKAACYSSLLSITSIYKKFTS
jgi:hypothetical protein